MKVRKVMHFLCAETASGLRRVAVAIGSTLGTVCQRPEGRCDEGNCCHLEQSPASPQTPMGVSDEPEIAVLNGNEVVREQYLRELEVRMGQMRRDFAVRMVRSIEQMEESHGR